VGLASGRLIADSNPRRRVWLVTLAAVVLAMLPDADTALTLLSIPDHGLAGHRGFFHTPCFALLVGAAVALVLRVRGSARPIRGAVIATLLVASHGLLDAMAQDGRGIFFLWPFSDQRFHLPWRPIPDAPTGLRFFSRVGMQHLAIELAYFGPVVLTMWAPAMRRAFARRRSPLPLRPPAPRRRLLA